MKKTALLVFCFSILFSAYTYAQKQSGKYVKVFTTLISMTRILEPSEFERELHNPTNEEVLLKYVPGQNVFDFVTLVDTVKYEILYKIGWDEFQISASEPSTRKLYFTRMFYVNGSRDDNFGFGLIKGSNDPKWRLDVFLYETFAIKNGSFF